MKWFVLIEEHTLTSVPTTQIFSAPSSSINISKQPHVDPDAESCHVLKGGFIIPGGIPSTEEYIRFAPSSELAAACVADDFS